jgi:O-antigen ligase
MTPPGPTGAVGLQVDPRVDERPLRNPATALERRPSRNILQWRPDAVTLLSVIVFTTFVLPARLVVPGIGAVGTPTNLLGILGFFLWVLARMRGSRPRLTFQPVRVLTGVYLLAMVITFAGGFLRGMYPDESSNATRFVIMTVAITGIALVAADAIADRERLTLLLQRVVYGAAFMAFAGDLEFVTKYNLAQHMNIPGLVVNDAIIGLRPRGEGFDRVAGTASHYIEFGVVLAMVLPLAIHFALFAHTRGRRQFHWLLVILMAVGVPFSLSRSAVIALVVALLVTSAAWTWRAKLNAVVVALCAAIALRAAKPGLLGTIRSLFTNISSDPSTAGRTADYGPAFNYISQRPVFGRGAGTFIPSRYRFLDNQMLMTTIESGVVGLVALLVLLVGGMALAHRIGKFATDPATKNLGYALLGSFVAAFLTCFTFDSLSFPVFATVLFLFIGIAGAIWRLDRDARHARYAVDTLPPS